MPASDVLGQYNDSVTNPQPIFTKGAQNGGGALGLNWPHDVLVDTTGHRLFVVDSVNNRVLVYPLDSGNNLTSHAPTYVLGQPDFVSIVAVVTQSGLSTPLSLAYDSANSHLFVGDYGNSRILIFDLSQGIANGMNAAMVLGQSSFTTATATTTQSGLSSPRLMHFDAATNRLFVSDQGNNRILIFTGSTVATGMNAAMVLGQSSFTAATPATTQTGMRSPNGVLLFLSFVAVSDTGNHRTLVFSGSSLSNGVAAAKVLGQTTFTAGGASLSQSGLYNPEGLAYDATGDHLFVVNNGGRSVLVYTGAMLSTSMAATKVLGQTTFVDNIGDATQAGLNVPDGLSLNPSTNQLWVADVGHNRILAFDISSLSNGQNAVDVLGQYDDDFVTPVFTKSGPSNGPNLHGFYFPVGNVSVDIIHHRLFVPDAGDSRPDMGNNRVLVYNLDSANRLVDRIPDYVIGQPNFHFDYQSYPVPATQTSMNGPRGTAYDAVGNRLFVTDYRNKRVLVFSGASVATHMNASMVLGKRNFTTNTGTASQTVLGGPTAVAYDAVHNRLFVADTDANRILVFTGSTLSYGMSGAYVLGQATFSATSTATTQAGMNAPTGLAYDTTTNKLYVADSGNNRVLVFSGSTLSNGMNATAVLGQTSFIAAIAATTQAGMNSPQGVTYDTTAGRLFVVGNNRVLVFDLSAGLHNGQSAAFVLGQTTFTAATAATTQAGMSSPRGIVYDTSSMTLYVTETSNNRVLLYDLRSETTTSLTSSQSADANTLTLTATVSPSDAGGTMTFTDSSQSLGSVSIVNGVAFLDLPAFSYTAGTHSITATYSGNGAYVPSTSAAIIPVIRSVTTTTTTNTGGGGGGSRRITPTVSSSSTTRQTSSANSSAHSVVSSPMTSPRSSSKASVSSHSSSSSPFSFSSSVRFTTVNVHLRSSATKQSKAKTQLTPNTPVTLLEVLTDWAKVRTKDGKEGYVLRKFLRK